ncbi:hypothetical protein ACFLV7_01450 [Chloroflexota bacterium]
MTRERGLSPGVICEPVAQAGFRKYFHFGVRKLIADQPIMGRACLRLENIKEGLDMIEEYVISR